VSEKVPVSIPSFPSTTSYDFTVLSIVEFIKPIAKTDSPKESVIFAAGIEMAAKLWLGTTSLSPGHSLDAPEVTITDMLYFLFDQVQQGSNRTALASFASEVYAPPIPSALAPTPFLKNADPPKAAKELTATTANIRIRKPIFTDFVITLFP
jgi:hypothetical protein